MGGQLRIDSLSTLRQRKSTKWREYDSDVLPLPVAEMDYPVAEPIIEAVVAMMRRSDTGYLGKFPELGEAFSGFAQRRWNWTVDPQSIRIATDVGVANIEILRILGAPGDRVVVMPPIYPAFYNWTNEIHLSTLEVPLLHNEGNYSIDFEGLEREFAAGAKFFILSNPHNPLGWVFSGAELKRIAELAHRFHVTVLSDEIHAPLTYSQTTFIPFASVSDEARESTVTLTSASKSWNLAGLKCAIFFTENKNLHERLEPLVKGVRHRASLLGAEAHTVAFSQGDQWLDQAIQRMEESNTLLQQLVTKNWHGVKISQPQNSYLSWVDFSKTRLGEDPAAELLDKARVALSSGIPFGTGGKHHARLNFATSDEILEEAISRIATWL